MPLSIRQNMKPWEQSIVAAEGSCLEVIGCTDVIVGLGKLRRRHQIVVAPITQAGILGLDFLSMNGGVLDLPRRKLRFDSVEVPIISEGLTFTCCRITVAETVTIPAKQEVVIPGRLHNRNTSTSQGIIETSARFYKKDNGLLVGRTFICADQGRVPLRVFNLQPDACTLYKGTQIALLQSADEVGDKDGDLNTQNDQETDLHPELNKLYERSAEALNTSQRVKLKELLSGYDHIFSKSGELGRTDVVHHRINTGDARPRRQPARRLPHHQRLEAQKQVADMLEAGVISPSNSPWASPIVLVKKKDNSIRFCVDYRELNKVTVKDAYPLPRVDDTLDALAGSRWFSSLDLTSGYWQVEMSPQDKEKTAFTTGNGLYEFNVMPFGLCNAPSTFERLMELVLAGLHWETCLVYLDDILIYAQTFEDHVSRLGEIFTRLAKAKLKLKPKKCCLFQSEITYLGHVVAEKGVSTDPQKTCRVRDWPTPCNLKEVRSFIGLCSYYRRFIKDFACIASPLHKLTQKDVGFKWTRECETAFSMLKDRLTSAPVLAFPDFSLPFILDTDASGDGIGGVLSQVQDGQERVIGYASRKLSKSEQNYSVTKRELLAVVHFIKHYKHYLYGKKFMLRTDHGSLRWLYNFKDVQGQLARWLETLSSFDFDIHHRPGHQHKNADALSRIPSRSGACITEVTQTKVTCASISNVFSGMSKDELSQAQRNDPDLSIIIGWKEKSAEKPARGQVSSNSRETKGYWYLWDQLEIKDGVLCRRLEGKSPSSSIYQVVVPTTLRRDVLTQAHSSMTGGHLGYTKTFKKIQRSFHWLGCRTSVGRWVKQCEKCARRKSPCQKSRAPLQPSFVGAPLERIAIDIFGPLPYSRRRNRYIMVVMDYFTKWAEAYPLRNQEAETVAKVLVEQFICRFGVPLSIHTDQGTNFESRVFQSICRLLGINKTRTTPYHPQSDGLVERFNRTIQIMLSMYVKEDQSDWDVHLPYVMMAYRASEQDTTGVSPNRMMFGREVALPLDLLVHVSNPNLDHVPQEPETYATELYERLQHAFNVARQKIVGEQRRQKRLYDAKLRGTPYAVGDKVWLFNFVRKVGLNPKLQSHWKGPYVVIKRISDAVYRIKHLQSGHRTVVHFDRLKPCFVRDDVDTETPKEPEDPSQDGILDEADINSSSELDEQGTPDITQECGARGADGEAVDISAEEDPEYTNGASSWLDASRLRAISRPRTGADLSTDNQGRHPTSPDPLMAEDVQPRSRGFRRRQPPQWMRTGQYLL